MGRPPSSLSPPDDSAAPDQADLSLVDHLAELRRRMIKSLMAVAIGCLATWNFAPDILNFLLAPVVKAIPSHDGLIYTGLQDGFIITMKTSLWAGLFLTSPYWMYQMWAFVGPALYAREKKVVLSLTALACLLMLGGSAFAYYLAFPVAFEFFLGFSGPTMQPLLALDRYCSLAMSLILAFALAFQLPLILMFLGRLGLIDAPWLRRQRRYSILAIFVLAAFLTPPDVVSQLLLGGVLILLYELSILLVVCPPKKPDNETTA